MRQWRKGRYIKGWQIVINMMNDIMDISIKKDVWIIMDNI